MPRFKPPWTSTPDAPIFRSFPGAGPALAARLLAAFGTQRERFEDANQVAQFHTQVVRMRYRCPKFGRQTFHENAACAAKIEPWARAYYRRQRQRHEDKHHQACRALAYKLIRIYFACWKNRTPYRSEAYLQALQTNGSALSAELKQTCE